MKTAYIASCTADGGIHRYRMDDNGTLTWLDKTTMDRPMYMTVAGNKMYIVLRAPFEDSPNSGVVIYDILEDGALGNPTPIRTTLGQVACHIAAAGNDVFCANYISGSVIKLPGALVTHSGHSIHPQRQEAPHVHFVGITPDRKYICAADLGLDTIFVYDRDLNLVSKENVPAGHGARHLAFSEDGKTMFCVNELKSTVSVFSYEDGQLGYLETVSALPDNFTGDNLAAAIRVKGEYAYVSHRGADMIACLHWDGRHLKLCSVIPCGGASPRDFLLTDGYAVCANECSNNITVIKTDRDIMVKISTGVSIPAPLCVSVVEK